MTQTEEKRRRIEEVKRMRGCDLDDVLVPSLTRKLKGGVDTVSLHDKEEEEKKKAEEERRENTTQWMRRDRQAQDDDARRISSLSRYKEPID